MLFNSPAGRSPWLIHDRLQCWPRGIRLHKALTQISQNHAAIVVENPKSKSMTVSAAGTVESPGQYVRGKAGLTKAILDQGWGRWVGLLEYKQAWRGGWVLAVDPRNTSRTCPSCGHVDDDNHETQARFACVSLCSVRPLPRREANP